MGGASQASKQNRAGALYGAPAITSFHHFSIMKKFYQLERIRALNDEARMRLTDGVALFTAGVAALPSDDQAAILRRVFEFDDFDAENDPYGTHDFGAFDHKSHRIFWKVDCYDVQMQHGSPDPSDPRVTKRVLTIMLASEY